jgi:hypothetical protein
MVFSEDQKTFRNVPIVKAKEMKPITVLANEIGAMAVWETVTPIVIGLSIWRIGLDLECSTLDYCRVEPILRSTVLIWREDGVVKAWRFRCLAKRNSELALLLT